MAFTTNRRSALMLLMTPGLALLYGGMTRASTNNTMSPAPSQGRAGDPAWAHRGRWAPVFELPNAAIHTSVLPNGKVLFWGRRDQPTDSMHEHKCTPYLWDPRTGELIPTPQPTRADGTKVNLFCSGHAFLSDGRLLVVGGHVADGDGLDQACVYDYRTNAWAALPVMHQRLWYPTATALPDGTVLVSSGSYKDNGTVTFNDVPQIWDGRQWTPTARFTGLPPYSRIHISPSGKMFASGSNARTYTRNTNDPNAWTPLRGPRGLRRYGERQYGPSVMYDSGKVVYIGGSNDGTTDVPTAAAGVFDLCANPPTWREIPNMHFSRRQHHATILADGKVLVTGGTSGPGFNDLSPGKPVHVAEQWDPVTQEWEKLAAEDIDRCYHGTVVLLPDATVLSAGGGEFAVDGEANDLRDSHRNAQIFHPPYLFRGPRPVITSAPADVAYGDTFSVQTSGPDVGKVTWIRLPSVTHASDQNQRINILKFRCHDGSVTITAPERPDICPPGHYMLFVLSKDGVPSLARIVQIGLSTPYRPTQARPVPRAWSSQAPELRSSAARATPHSTAGLARGRQS